jgi:hypothetical protein
MTQNAPFPEAEDILWDVKTTDNANYGCMTSEYWMRAGTISLHQNLKR